MLTHSHVSLQQTPRHRCFYQVFRSSNSSKQSTMKALRLGLFVVVVLWMMFAVAQTQALEVDELATNTTNATLSPAGDSPTPYPTAFVEPTLAPSLSPSTESIASSSAPTGAPTQLPSVSTQSPSPLSPSTSAPTLNPTKRPTKTPTAHPTKQPTLKPTMKPTALPTPEPTMLPTPFPTHEPTQAPSSRPTNAPTQSPTLSWSTSDLVSVLNSNSSSISSTCLVRKNSSSSWQSVDCTDLGMDDAASESSNVISSSDATSQDDYDNGNSGDSVQDIVVTMAMGNHTVFAAQYEVCSLNTTVCSTGTPDSPATGYLSVSLKLTEGTYDLLIAAQVSSTSDEETVLLVKSERLFLVPEVELGEDAVFVSQRMQHVGIALAVISWATIAGLGIWQLRYKDHRIVLIGQSDLLLLILFGTTVSTLTILLFATPSSKACEAASWTYSLGFSITFAGIIGKLWRAHKIFNNPAMKVRKNVRRNLIGGSILVVLIDLVILIAWTATDTLSLQSRATDQGTVYICTSDHAWVFIALVLVNHGAVLIFGLWKANEDKDLNPIVSEARELRFVLAASIIVPCLMIPLLWVYYDNPDLRYALSVIVVFVTNMSILAICFFPRILHIHVYHTQEINLARPSHHERVASFPDLALQVGGRRTPDDRLSQHRSQTLDTTHSIGHLSSDSHTTMDRISGKVPDSIMRLTREMSIKLSRSSTSSRGTGSSPKSFRVTAARNKAMQLTELEARSPRVGDETPV